MESNACYLNVASNVCIGKQRPGGVMDSASDFGSEGCGFKSHLGRYFYKPELLINKRYKHKLCTSSLTKTTNNFLQPLHLIQIAL